MELVVADLGRHFNSLKTTGHSEVRGNDTILVGEDGPVETPPQKLAETRVVNSTFGSYNRLIQKTASGVSYGQPIFFSPVYTPMNWQIPSRRRELYMWSFLPDSQIFTTQGTIPVQEVIEGEETVTHKGTLGKVDKTTCRSVDTTAYTVDFQGYHEPLRITEGHKMAIIRKEDILCKYCRGGKSGRRFCCEQYMCKRTGCDRYNQIECESVEVTVENVREGDYVFTPIPRNVIDSEIDSIEKARLLGYYCAEGCLHGKSGVILTFGLHEKKYVDEVTKLLLCCFQDAKIKIHERLEKSIFQVHVNSKPFTDFCDKHCGHLAVNKTLSRELLFCDPDLQFEFLGAYWNGDGNQCFKKGSDGQLNISTASRSLSDQIVIVLARCGIPARVYHGVQKNDRFGTLMSENSIKKEFHIYRIVFGIRNSCEFSKVADCAEYDRIPHTSNSIRIVGDKILRRITSIKRSPYKGPVYDVRVPGDFSLTCSMIGVFQCRYWYENEPLVAASLDFHSRFPITGFETDCRNRYIKHFYDQLNKKLNLDKWLRIISHETYLIGDCFPFLEIDCPNCGGSGRVGDQVCDHEGGTFKRILILNPDFVEVFTNPIAPEEVITYIPDDELKDLVTKNGPGSDKLSREVKQMVTAGQPIPLDNFCVSHLKHGDSGYRRYGISMIRRLFPILSYKTKIMTAQWIVAERLIIPIKVVKVGSEDRPAGEADIAAVQSQLLATTNDPNLCIVTHHAFELDWVGACHDSETEILTESGWKTYDELGEVKVATFNLEKRTLEFELPQEYHEYDYDGELVHIKGRHFDVMVTPNHKMLASERVWNNDTMTYDHSPFHKVRADQVVENTKFLTTADWFGELPQELPYKTNEHLSHLTLDEYLTFAGYYISEGGLKVDNGVINAWYLTQAVNNPCFSEIREIAYKVGGKVQESLDDRYDNDCYQFVVNDSAFARSLVSEFGDRGKNKHIPSWVLQLPKRELAILLSSLMKGNGDVSFSSGGKPRFRYSTTSNVLADQVQELVFKLGYCPQLSMEPRCKEEHNNVYRVNWCESSKGKGGIRTVKDRNIHHAPYQGKVWCVTVKNGYFITRRNGKIAIHGNSGKILQVSSEYEYINQEILNGVGLNKQLITGEGPCYHPDVEILTEYGWKRYGEVGDNEKLATFNKNTGALEYQNFKNRIVKQYDDELVHFETNKIDMLVTKNHRMWTSPRGWKDGKEGYYEWKVVSAEDVKHRSRMRACIDEWEGEIPDEYANGVDFGGVSVNLMDFVRFLGYYLSEGWASESNGGINQKSNTDSCDRITETFECLGIPHASWNDKRGVTQFSIRKPQRLWLVENVPGKAREKFIPTWVKHLPKEYLFVLLEALIDGDGSIHSKQLKVGSLYRSYISGSKRLADDVMEIAFKLGFSPIMSYVREETDSIYVVNIPSSNIGRFPVLDTLIFGNKSSERRRCISRVPYKGTVWCFEVPNEFLIVRYNGKPLVCGNTYASAAMGAEIMIRRLESWRLELKRWVEERIYLPIAKMMGFIEKNEWGEMEYIYPKIRWDSLNLRDRQGERQMLLNLYDKGLISARRVLEEFEIDPDAEFEQMRYERIEMASQAPPGQMAGGAPGMELGGAMGGLGGLEMGGGAPPLGEGGLGEPGGMGGMEGGAPVAEGAAGMGAPASALQEVKVAQVLPGQNPPADVGQYGGKLLTQKTREKLDRERAKSMGSPSGGIPAGRGFSGAEERGDGFMRDQQGRIMMTSLERKVIEAVEQHQRTGKIPFNAYPSYEVKVGESTYLIDIAFPDIKVAIECDGKEFHSSPDAVKRDQARDHKLNNLGWKVMRFGEKDIENNIGGVMNRVASEITKREIAMKKEIERLQRRREKDKIGVNN